jgi:hypothetical protein
MFKQVKSRTIIARKTKCCPHRLFKDRFWRKSDHWEETVPDRNMGSCLDPGTLDPVCRGGWEKGMGGQKQGQARLLEREKIS